MFSFALLVGFAAPPLPVDAGLIFHRHARHSVKTVTRDRQPRRTVAVVAVAPMPKAKADCGCAPAAPKLPVLVK